VQRSQTIICVALSALLQSLREKLLAKEWPTRFVTETRE
jgi:hypothetical protein